MDVTAQPVMKGHRWFAALWDFLVRREPAEMKRLRAQVAGGATGRVLEIGAGTGTNLPYYRQAEQLVLAEPDPYMVPRLRKEIEALGRNVPLHRAPAEKLDLPDAAFDTVVCTLVLCSVQSPARALAEVKRVLRPGGTLRFVEHVRGEGLEGRLHDLAAPVWRLLPGDCHLNRRTGRTLAALGFEFVELQRRRLPGGLPGIIGVARPT